MEKITMLKEIILGILAFFIIIALYTMNKETQAYNMHKMETCLNHGGSYIEGHCINLYEPL
jgi:hypothetical protein